MKDSNSMSEIGTYETLIIQEGFGIVFFFTFGKITISKVAMQVQIFLQIFTYKHLHVKSKAL